MRRGIITGVVLALAVPAQAEGDEPRTDAGFDGGRVTLRGAAEVGASSSLAVDAFYAVNARFRLGLTMSHDARRELAAGRGLCVYRCTERFAGLAAETQVRLGSQLVGRAAIDTARFGPTAAAIELGADAHVAQGAVTAQISPVLRLGIARRDLANTDSAAALAQLGVRVWPTGGVLAATRVGVSLGDLRATPSVGAAAGIWLELGAFVLSARFGAAEVARSRSTDALFAELALTWSN